MNNSFLSQMAHVGWNVSRYFLASATVMLGTISVMTGQFPPPVFEVYKSVKEIKSSLNLAQSAASLAAAKIERDKVLKEINSEQRSIASTEVDLSNGTQTKGIDSEQRIKSLEYEVALLKSKLYRAEWEAEQFKEQAAAAKK